MKKLDKTNKDPKPLNKMDLHERIEYQRIHDRTIISQAFMQNTKVELKTLTGKRIHPFAIQNIQNN